MPTLLLGLLTSAVAVLGGRPAELTARIAAALGASAGLLVVGWSSAIVSSALAAWAATLLAWSLPAAAKSTFVAAALALAALELLLRRERVPPVEPTRSLGAITLVLLAGQLTDAARLSVLALAVATGAPAFAALGGALGSGAVLTAAWALGSEWDARLPLRAIRMAAGGVFGLAAIVVTLAPRGLIG